jgi:hypothetical protein
MFLLVPLLSTTVLFADASKSRVDAAAVIVEVDGDAFVRMAGKTRSAESGDRLDQGNLLLLDEDAEALLLYSGGKYSRVRGPARVRIDRIGADQPGRSLGERLKNRLAGSFSTQRRQRLTSTVAGVRGGDVVLISPARGGITAGRFPIVARPRVIKSRQLNNLALADEVHVVGLDGDHELFRVTIDTNQLTKACPHVDLRDAKRDRAYTIDVRLVEVDDSGEVIAVRDERRSTFRLADGPSDKKLAVELEALDQQDLCGAAAALARVDICLEHDFQGQAAAEAASMASKHPENPFWSELMLSLTAVGADQDTNAR